MYNVYNSQNVSHFWGILGVIRILGYLGGTGGGLSWFGGYEGGLEVPMEVDTLWWYLKISWLKADDGYGDDDGGGGGGGGQVTTADRQCLAGCLCSLTLSVGRFSSYWW